MGLTKIEWTDFTFNPWIGCTKVSAGCKNCYAEADMDKRRGRAKWGDAGTRSTTSPSYWRQPFKWNQQTKVEGERRRVFCASLADVFEDWQGQVIDASGQLIWWPVHEINSLTFDNYKVRLTDAYAVATLHLLRQKLFRIIESTPHLDWLLLTKRPENIMRMVPERWRLIFPENVWIGTSVEDQTAADERIPHLLTVPAKVRFLSCEPLLGPLDLGRWIGPTHIDELCRRCGHFENTGVNNGYGCAHPDQEEVENGHGKCYAFSCPLGNSLYPNEPLDEPIYRAFGMSGDEEDFLLEEQKGIHWIIAGGESGPHARPMHPDWARSLRDQCQAAEIPFLFKQWGEWRQYDHWDGDNARPLGMFQNGIFSHGNILWDFKKESVHMAKVGKKTAGRLLDGREWNESPNV